MADFGNYVSRPAPGQQVAASSKQDARDTVKWLTMPDVHGDRSNTTAEHVLLSQFLFLHLVVVASSLPALSSGSLLFPQPVDSLSRSRAPSEARRNFKLRFLQQNRVFSEREILQKSIGGIFLLWHFVEVSYNGSKFRNFELFFPGFPSKRNPPHGTIDRSPVAGLRLSNASPPYIGHRIDGRSARVFLSFFFFFGFRLSVQVQVKGKASFEGLPRLCGRPRDCRHAGSIGRRLVRSIPGCKSSSLNVAHQPIELKLYQISLQTPRRV